MFSSYNEKFPENFSSIWHTDFFCYKFLEFYHQGKIFIAIDETNFGHLKIQKKWVSNEIEFQFDNRNDIFDKRSIHLLLDTSQNRIFGYLLSDKPVNGNLFLFY